jgi:hypothetical protein
VDEVRKHERRPKSEKNFATHNTDSREGIREQRKRKKRLFASARRMDGW